MNTSSNLLRPFRYLGAALLLAAGLAACSTGTESGDTNVERGHEKEALDPGAGHPSGGVDSARLQRDTATSLRERQYQQARQAKDRNNDGRAD
ncbi:hypothetical protein [Hymenobacter latericus]|uniref:hypothetical protein n=1 Tax=Hymenobacter sp. YIM 151858-1 TaxID=2987688 RepID=UPI002225E704|nr:hypothetical protein [Hymenobacter sp. YIM 151858-1]UYZ58862.1 hypothetical protein OIS50_17595 [Hymenobacter sp. YIM 151858-1]